MYVAGYYRSLTDELNSLKHRVRNFIHDGHWLTDGEWKESVLRSILARNLPDTTKIGRGFVLTKTGPTTQCDILLYRSDCPVLFREGDLVFVTPDAVLGIIEVKSRLNRKALGDAIGKLGAIGSKLGQYREHCFLGIFAYESAIAKDETILDELRKTCQSRSQRIDLISLGTSTFVKWWQLAPGSGTAGYETWHCYHLEEMAAGYFISNALGAIASDSVGRNNAFWFPDETKEVGLRCKMPFNATIAAKAKPKAAIARGGVKPV